MRFIENNDKSGFVERTMLVKISEYQKVDTLIFVSGRSLRAERWPLSRERVKTLFGRGTMVLSQDMIRRDAQVVEGKGLFGPDKRNHRH